MPLASGQNPCLFQHISVYVFNRNTATNNVFDDVRVMIKMIQFFKKDDPTVIISN